jgi:hypothetical protein
MGMSNQTKKKQFDSESSFFLVQKSLDTWLQEKEGPNDSVT